MPPFSWTSTNFEYISKSNGLVNAKNMLLKKEYFLKWEELILLIRDIGIIVAKLNQV